MIITEEENLTFLFEHFNIIDEDGTENNAISSTTVKKEVLKNDLSTKKNVETIIEKGPIPTYNRKPILPYAKQTTFRSKVPNTFTNNIPVSVTSKLNITSHVNIHKCEDTVHSVQNKSNYDDIDQEVIKEIMHDHEKIADQMVENQKGTYNLCKLLFSNEDYSLNKINQTLSDLEDVDISYSTPSTNKEFVAVLSEFIEPEISDESPSPSTSESSDYFDKNCLEISKCQIYDTTSLSDEESKLFFIEDDYLNEINGKLIDVDVDNSCSTSSKEDEFEAILNELTDSEKSPYTPSISPSNDSSDINYSEIIQNRVPNSRKTLGTESKFGKSEINNNVQTFKFGKYKQSTFPPLKQEVLIPNLPIFNNIPSKAMLENKMCDERKKQIWIHVSNMSTSDLTKVVSNNETFLVHLLKSPINYKLEKIFAVVERLKLEKCLKVPSNDHEKGLLYNAIVYCSNEPLVARYIAESMVDINIDINEVYGGKTLMEYIKMKHGDKYDVVCNEFIHLIKNC